MSLADQFKRAANKAGGSELADLINSQIEAKEQEDAKRKQERARKEKEREERQGLVDEYEPYELEHNGYHQRGKYFINPYTFFPLEETQPERNVPERFYGGLTGKLTCELEIVEGSPLFIPNTTKAFSPTEVGARGQDSEAEHRWFDFFSYDDLTKTGWREQWPKERKPKIPGSSLRGMARSIYEQLTNSCYSQIDEKNYPNKRTNHPKKPYRMEWGVAKGEWLLYEIEVVHVGHWHPANPNRPDRLGVHGSYSEYVIDEEGLEAHRDSTYVVRGDAIHRFDATQHKGRLRYAFHPTGEINKKHLTLFPLQGGTEVNRSLSEDALKRFERVVDTYCETSTEANHNNARAGYEVYRDRYKHHKPILVYADDSLEYLSPACMSREYFKKTISKLLEEHAPCAGDKLCPACRLFGTVNKKASLGSRVRFSDGVPSAYEFDGWTTLPALSSPKISATEFYLKRPADNGDLYWNYDYYTRHGEHGAHHGYKAKPNGRKVYLHHSMDLGRHYGGELLNKKKTNITVHPLKQGTFTFDVYFEDVSEEELANLVFALGGTKGRLQMLGHGKPLGMGSVEVKVAGITTRSYNPNTFEAADKPLSGEEVTGWLPADADAVARRRLIEHFSQDLSGIPQIAGGYVTQANMGKLVRYPTSRPGQLSNNNASFTWFVNNRGTVRDPAIEQTLHVPSLEDMGDAHE